MNKHSSVSVVQKRASKRKILTSFKMLNVIFAFTIIIKTTKSEPICEERSYFSTTDKLTKELFCKQIPPERILKKSLSLQVYGDIKEIKYQLRVPGLKMVNLNLSHCGISEIKPNAFVTMNKLSTLDLSKNNLELITEDIFRNLSSLELLSLEGNGIKVIIDGALKDLKSLRELNLANNKLLEIPSDLPPSIKVLNLLNNVIEIISLDTINGLNNLENLNLCGNEIYTWTVENYLSQLKRLCIGERVASSGGKFWNTSAMEDLYISSSHMNDSYLNANLKDTIQSLLNLQRLSIENYEMDSFEFLKDMIHLHSLTLVHIQLKENDIGAFPSNLKKLMIIKSPALARQILDKGPSQKLEFLELKNNDVDKIISKQNVKLFMTVDHLDLSLNPLNCTKEDWLWMLEKLQMKKNFLINSNQTICNEPPEVKGLTLFEVLNNQFDSYDKEPYNMTEGNKVKRGHLDIESTYSKTDVLYGILLFLLFVACFLAIMALCNKLSMDFCRKNAQDINLQGASDNSETNHANHNNSNPVEKVITSSPQMNVNNENNSLQSDDSTKFESFQMRVLEH